MALLLLLLHIHCVRSRRSRSVAPTGTRLRVEHPLTGNSYAEALAAKAASTRAAAMEMERERAWNERERARLAQKARSDRGWRERSAPPDPARPLDLQHLFTSGELQTTRDDLGRYLRGTWRDSYYRSSAGLDLGSDM